VKYYSSGLDTIIVYLVYRAAYTLLYPILFPVVRVGDSSISIVLRVILASVLAVSRLLTVYTLYITPLGVPEVLLNLEGLVK
jgi:hypothetical protein